MFVCVWVIISNVIKFNDYDNDNDYDYDYDDTDMIVHIVMSL